jgi:hypothetical protein
LRILSISGSRVEDRAMSAIEGQTGLVAGEDALRERKWRRWSLWAIVALLPLAAAAMSFEHARWVVLGNDLIARDIPAGTDVRFGGSDWRLVGIRTYEDVDSPSVPEDAAAVAVDFTVRVGEAKNVLKVGDMVFEQLWGACRIGLVDDRGRSWVANNFMRVLDLKDEADEGVDTCQGHSQSNAPPEAALKVRETFVVPKEIADEVRPTLGLEGEPPFYLRFERPGS